MQKAGENLLSLIPTGLFLLLFMVCLQRRPEQDLHRLEHELASRMAGGLELGKASFGREYTLRLATQIEALRYREC